jgi:hypothetical protein
MFQQGRVNLVVYQEQMNIEQLEGQDYPTNIVPGLNLKQKLDFELSPAGRTNGATNHEGFRPMM